MKTRPKPQPGERPKQPTPQEIRDDLLQAIRAGFYADDEKGFFQDRGFLLARVVLWPAGWLNQRGVTLKPERYKAIILDILQEAKRYGNTSKVKYPPAWLMKCVQSHFEVHEQEIYDEAKQLRTRIENVILLAGQRPAQAPDPIKALAEARAALQINRRKATPKAAPKQLSLL